METIFSVGVQFKSVKTNVYNNQLVFFEYADFC